MGGIKDQLSFYYSKEDYEFFLKFFQNLRGNGEFSYDEYLEAHKKFVDDVLNYHTRVPEFVETPDVFLQFLYDSNILCYIEDAGGKPLFRWCYRERKPSNISPKVQLGMRYRVHYGLMKALNLGKKTR